jgi:hypothetical protein
MEKKRISLLCKKNLRPIGKINLLRKAKATMYSKDGNITGGLGSIKMAVFHLL